MEILLWWLPPVVVTVIAALWVGRAARLGALGAERDDAARERMGQAIQRDQPRRSPRGQARSGPVAPRSTGVAVRPSQDETRRSA